MSCAVLKLTVQKLSAVNGCSPRSIGGLGEVRGDVLPDSDRTLRTTASSASRSRKEPPLHGMPRTRQARCRSIPDALFSSGPRTLGTSRRCCCWIPVLSIEEEAREQSSDGKGSRAAGGGQRQPKVGYPPFPRSRPAGRRSCDRASQ